MNARNFVLFVSAALAAASPLHAQPAEPKVGDRIAVFEMKRERRSNQDVSRLSAAVAEVLSGAKLQAAPEVKPAPRARGEHRRLRVTVPEGPPLRIRYLPETDELRALNVEVAADTRPAKDVGQPAAVDLARRAVRQLAAAGVVDARHFDLATPDVASTWVGEGSVDGRVREVRRRVEYRVTWRRRLNGIDFANAGVRVAVHASGRLAGLRIGGVGVVAEPNGAIDDPKGGGRWLERKVASADIARRFRAGRVAGRRHARRRLRARHVRDAGGEVRGGGRAALRLFVLAEVQDRRARAGREPAQGPRLFARRPGGAARRPGAACPRSAGRRHQAARVLTRPVRRR